MTDTNTCKPAGFNEVAAAIFKSWSKRLSGPGFMLPAPGWSPIQPSGSNSCCGKDLQVGTWEGPADVFEGLELGGPSAASFRCVLPLPANVDNVHAALMNVDRRAKWEPRYRSYVLIEQFAFSDLLYHVIGLGPKFLCRSYLLRRRSTITPDGGYLITQHSDTHPDYPDQGAGLPARAKVLFQGTRLRQLPPPEAVPNAPPPVNGAPVGPGVLVEVLSLQDMGSQLPGPVRRYVCAKEPWKWAHALFHDVVAHAYDDDKQAAATARARAEVVSKQDSRGGGGGGEGGGETLVVKPVGGVTVGGGNAAKGGEVGAAAAATQQHGWHPVSPLLRPVAAVWRGVGRAAGAVGRAVGRGDNANVDTDARVREMYDKKSERADVSRLTPIS